jgi:hypothetical protein
VVVVMLVIALVTAGVVAANRSHDTATNPPSGNSSSPADGPTTPPPPTFFSGDLRTLLVTPPKSSHPFADPISKDGTLTKQDVADAFDDPTSVLNVLDEYNFSRGAIVQWHDADDTQVTIKLYQFDDEDHAGRWLNYNQEGYDQDATKTNQSPIAGIDGSGLYVSKKVDDKGYILTNGVASKGNIYMIVFVWQVDRQDKTAAVNIIKQQFQKLP